MEGERARTRRAVLNAGLAGTIAAVVAAVGRSAPTDAANGDRLKIGSTQNDASAPTNLNAHSAAGYGLGVDHAGTGPALWGNATGPSAFGIEGSSSGTKGVGVFGSGKAIGVQGTVTSPDGVAVSGIGNGTVEQGSIAVQGLSAVGYGVFGQSGQGGVGVHAESTAQNGVALQVQGRATFTRSKLVTVTAGTASKEVSVAGVTTNSWVVATLQKDVPGLFVRAAVATTGKVTVHLNKATNANVTVGFFVVN